MNPERKYPQENIGKPYRRGMLPYGGSVSSRGIITQVVSEDEYQRDMDILLKIIGTRNLPTH